MSREEYHRAYLKEINADLDRFDDERQRHMARYGVCLPVSPEERKALNALDEVSTLIRQGVAA